MPSAEVFLKTKPKKKRSPDMATLMGNRPTVGEVGLEIEAEGYNLPSHAFKEYWTYHIDNSLRAPKNRAGMPGMTAEYVLTKPIAFSEVPKALDYLWDCFTQSKSKFVESNRTSVHVHLNCQKWFLNRLTSFAALYFIVEEVLTEWCGEHRVGNLFCLRAIDAEAIVSYLKGFIECDGQAGIQEFLHYSAFNANALKKYGSLELRTLRGTNDKQVILDWVETLERLYKLSEDFPDPREICASLSSVGPLTFFNSILGPKAAVIRNGINMTDQQLGSAVYNGVRIAQELCYCKDWDEYVPLKLKPDVWNRPLSRIAKKVMNFQDPAQGEMPWPSSGNTGPAQPWPLETGDDLHETVDDLQQMMVEVYQETPDEYPMENDEGF